MRIPPQYRRPLDLADRDVKPDVLEQRAKVPANLREGPDARWLRELELLLEPHERSFLHRTIADMPADRLERVQRLAPEAAAAALREAMRNPGLPPTLTTRKPFLCDDEGSVTDVDGYEFKE